METVMCHSSSDHPIFPHKSQIAKAPKKDLNRQSSISRPSENFYHINLQTGFLQASSSRPFHSYPAFSSQQQQPPLLPLPLPHTRIRDTNLQPPVRGLSCPPTNKITNNNTRARGSCPTPRLSKPLPTSPNNSKPITKVGKASFSSTKPTGPDPEDHIEKVAEIIALSSSGNTDHTVGIVDDVGSLKWMKDEVHDFSGPVVFALSPPPSSLPLPTFSRRAKLSCSIEAAGFDAGATDNLRRLLRLR